MSFSATVFPELLPAVFFFHPDHHEGRGAGAGHKGAPVPCLFVLCFYPEPHKARGGC